MSPYWKSADAKVGYFLLLCTLLGVGATLIINAIPAALFNSFAAGMIVARLVFFQWPHLMSGCGRRR